MIDPVRTKYGDTFERKNIVKKIEESGMCPLKNQPLSKEDLTPNRTLRDVISEYRN